MNLRRSTLRRLSVPVAIALLAIGSASAAGGRVTGFVTDAEGAKLQDVVIKLIPQDPAFTTLEVKPNKKGKFAFGLIRSGQYRLVAFSEGRRIARVDATIAVPDDDDLWSVAEDVELGAELPAFAVSGVTTMRYDLVFEPHDEDPGTYGTGQPVSPIEKILTALAEDRLDEALAEIEAAREREPENATANYLAAFAYRLGDSHEQALKAIETCLRVDPAFEGASLLKGKIIGAMGRHDDALTLYRAEAQNAASENVRRDAYLEQAILLQDMGNDTDAITALEQLIELAPDLTAAYGDLAALYLKTGQPDKAKQITERVIELGGSNPDLLYNLGVERFNNNDFEAAAGYFDKVVEVAPDHPEAHLQLGYTQLNLGDQESAVSHLKRFLEVASQEHPGRSTAQAIVQQLSGS